MSAGPKLTPDEWRVVLYALEERIESCRAELERAERFDLAAADHWRAELAKAEPLAAKVDAERPLYRSHTDRIDL